MGKRGQNLPQKTGTTTLADPGHRSPLPALVLPAFTTLPTLLARQFFIKTGKSAR
jgi:hypothetical protein